MISTFKRRSQLPPKVKEVTSHCLCLVLERLVQMASIYEQSEAQSYDETVAASIFPSGELHAGALSNISTRTFEVTKVENRRQDEM